MTDTPNIPPEETAKSRRPRRRKSLLRRAVDWTRTAYLRWDVQRERKRRRRGRTFFGRSWNFAIAVITWPMRTTVWLVDSTLISAGAATQFVVALWEERQLSHLAQGLPALVGVTMIIGLAMLAGVTEARITSNYLDASVRAMQKQDFPGARVYLERLARLDGGKSATRFDLAMTLSQLGEHDRAAAIIKSLAPLDKPGFGRAHLWIAQHLLLSGQVVDRDRLQAETHLQHAISQLSDRNLRMARGLLGSVYAKTGRPTEAVDHLQAALASFPQFYPDLALAHQLLGQSDRARDVITAARDGYRKMSLDEPTNVEIRIEYAAACTIMTDFPQAVLVVEQGREIAPSPELDRALARIYLTWAATVGRTNPDDMEEQLRLLSLALKANPEEPALFPQVMQVLNSQGRTAAEARELLEDMLVNGNATALVHALLGTYAGESGNTKQAIHHLEIALRLDPSIQLTANNLAWYLAHADPPDLDRAMALIDSLVERWPEYAEFRETRGQILAKLQRWSDAIADLQAVVGDIGDATAAHRTLAVAYRGLGMEAIAEKHERAAAGSAMPASNTKANANPE